MKFHYIYLEDCTQSDKFDFAPPLTREDGSLITRYIKPLT